MRHAYKEVATGKVHLMTILSGDPIKSLMVIFNNDASKFEYLGPVEDKINRGAIDLTKQHALVADGYNNIVVDSVLEHKTSLRIAKEEIAKKGFLKKKLADKILAIIAGHNEKNGLDASQIASLEQRYPEILSLLQKGMPMTAKPLIEGISPDGVVITQEELDHVALEYEDFLEENPWANS